jgi:APA family basic amino acid/polyamine antiporter
VSEFCRMSPKQVFVREATGLVREIDLKGATVYNILFNGFPMLQATTILILVPFMFPGADYVLAWILAGVGLTFNGLVYAYMTAAMPRSGGEYVFISRVISPEIGFIVNFAWVFIIISWLGWDTSICVAVVSSFLSVLAPATGSAGVLGVASILLSSVEARTLVGSVIILINVGLALMPVGKYMRAIVIAVVGGFIVSSAISFGLFLVSTPSSFAALFNQYMRAYSITDAYKQVLTTAYAAGYGGAQPYSLGATVPCMAFVCSYTSASFMTTYFGGEIRRGGEVRRHAISMVFGGLYAIVFLQILLWIFMSTVLTREFVGAASYLYFNGQSIIPTDPLWYFYTYVLAIKSVPLLILLFVGYMLMAVPKMSGELLMPSRCAFAWSFDRLAPSKFAEVSERFRVPIYTVLAATVVGFVFLAWMTGNGPSYITMSSITTFVVLILWAVVAITAIVFPYRSRSAFEASRVGTKIAGIPVISIVGAISLAFVSWLFLTFYLNASFTGYTWFTWIIMAVLYGGALAYYYLVVYYRKRQGVEVALAFRELPPE